MLQVVLLFVFQHSAWYWHCKFLANDTQKCDSECKSRYDQQKTVSFLWVVSDKQRQLYLSYPHEEVADQVEGRKGKFSDLSQMVGIGMLLREKKADILALFDWNDNEISELKKLCWKGGRPDTLENRKYKYLAYLFEAVYAVSIAPEVNPTQNPTGEWELKYYG